MADQDLKEGLEREPESSSSSASQSEQPNPVDTSATGNDDGGDEKEVQALEKGDNGSDDALDPEGKKRVANETALEADSASEDGLDELESEDLGLSITDDELWDEGGGLDEIPLFDELADAEQEGEKVTEAAPGEREETKAGGTDRVEAKEEPKEGPGEKDLIQEDVTGTKGSEEEGEEAAGNPIWAYIPFIFAGFNVLLFIVGLVVLVKLLTTPHVQSVKPQGGIGAKSAAVEEQERDIGSNTIENGSNEVKAPRAGFYTMTLDPFIIPAQLNGEVVFFKLKAELVFDDASSKRAFSQRESALRDIIYSELNGIDITAGLSNKGLFSYRRLIIKKLNDYFSPHKVKDIRLVGFILK